MGFCETCMRAIRMPLCCVVFNARFCAIHNTVYQSTAHDVRDGPVAGAVCLAVLGQCVPAPKTPTGRFATKRSRRSGASARYLCIMRCWSMSRVPDAGPPSPSLPPRAWPPLARAVAVSLPEDALVLLLRKLPEKVLWSMRQVSRQFQTLIDKELADSVEPAQWAASSMVCCLTAHTTGATRHRASEVVLCMLRYFVVSMVAVDLCGC